MPRVAYRAVGLTFVFMLLAACTGVPKSSAQGQQCSRGLDTAYAELRTAKTNGLGGTVEWSKAASLLSAAKVQYEFEHYPNCIEKVNRARGYIRSAQAG